MSKPEKTLRTPTIFQRPLRLLNHFPRSGVIGSKSGLLWIDLFFSHASLTCVLILFGGCVSMCRLLDWYVSEFECFDWSDFPSFAENESFTLLHRCILQGSAERTIKGYDLEVRGTSNGGLKQIQKQQDLSSPNDMMTS